MFRIEYETEALGTRWLATQYDAPDDADRIARRLIDSTNEILSTTVVEQAGYVYSQWSRR